jgi:hypothetical protein
MRANEFQCQRVFRVSRYWTIGIAVLSLVLLLSAQGKGQVTSVRLTAIDSPPVEGKLIAADSQTIRLEVAGESKSWNSQEVLNLELARKSSAASPPLELGLIDGSKLKGVKLAGREQKWQFGDSAGEVQDFGPGVVRSLLVRSLTPELSTAWNESLKESAESDALIVMRPGNVVDRVNGMIVEVKDSKVGFDLDGQVVEVGFEKLLGIIWFRKQKDRLRPKIEIQCTDGSSILSESLSISGDMLTYRSIGGQDLKIPVWRIAVLNYANANVKWLAEIAPLSAISHPRIDWNGDRSNFNKAMAPRFIASRGVGSISDSGKAENLDLVFLAPGSYAFRVPEGVARLRTTVERSGNGNAKSDLLIEVWQDDQNLKRHAFGVDEESLELEVPVVSGKKVTLSVVSKTRLQVGSQMTWKQPRLIR